MISSSIIGGLTTSRELRVYAALALYANPAGRCWPAIEAIEGHTNLHRRAVQRTVNTLELSGAILTFPAQARRGCSIYELQPDPNVWCEDWRSDEDGPGGFFGSLAYTTLHGLKDDGIDVAVRLRPNGRRNRLIDRWNRDRDDRPPLLTPGIQFVCVNADQLRWRSRRDRWGALVQLASLEEMISNGMVPWSVVKGILHMTHGCGQNDRPSEKQGADKTSAPGADKTTAPGADKTTARTDQGTDCLTDQLSCALPRAAENEEKEKNEYLVGSRH